jgi:hypothetical protein
MSFLEFTRIRDLLPDREHVWNAIEQWTKSHPERAAVPVIELLSDLAGDVDAIELLHAIDALVATGTARRSYRVVDPAQRVLLPESYNARAEIPEKVQNNWDLWIDVHPKDITLVLEHG